MKLSTPSTLNRPQIQRWLALPASIGLGLLFAIALIALLAPRPGVAVAAPAVVYTCDEPGLNAALGAGGLATFNCGAPVTVTLSARKLVTRDVSLDGGNRLTLSGGGVRGILTVPVGVHLSLLNLTLFNALADTGAAIYNSGVATITHTRFYSNSAGGGSALFNDGGSSAFIGNSLVEFNETEAGAVWNGNVETITGSAALTVVHTTFQYNRAANGAAIVAGSGPTWITGSTFYANNSYVGGAIFAVSSLTVNNSDFVSNVAIVPAALLAGPTLPGLSQPALTQVTDGDGGAIAIQETAVVLVAGSHFTGNVAGSRAGAIVFDYLSKSSLSAPAVPPPLGSLLITGSSFVSNCAGEAGGAIANGLTTTVINSSFSLNLADSAEEPLCLDSQAAQGQVIHGPAGIGRQPAAPAGGPFGSYIGAGGAIFNFAQLWVTGTTFLTNTATVTTAGGGGAIANSPLTELHVAASQFYGNQALNNGGAIFSDLATSGWISGSDFRRNSAQEDSGGAITNLGVLSVTNSSFSANDAGSNTHLFLGGGGGAIFSGSPFLASSRAPVNGPAGAGQPPLNPAGFNTSLLIDHSTFISNASEWEGGALDAGNATLIASTFTSNTAVYGGAIDVLPGDSFVISASTFIANAAITTSLDGAQEGGAIDTNGYAVSVINSTFYANQATGGARGGAINGESLFLSRPSGGSPSPTVITNSTFLSNTAAPGNGGAFGNNSTFAIHNTLVAYSLGGNCQFTMTLTGPNLEYPGTTCGGAILQDDPKALRPANNGGPTFTSAILPGSPAIDTGSNLGCPATDQRGIRRPINGDGVGPATCDLGAYEAFIRLFLPALYR